MPRNGIEKLTDLIVKNALPTDQRYKLYDGGGLQLEIFPNGSRYWRFRFRYAGKDKCLALGVYPKVSLKAAREAVRDAREELEAGADPTETKRQEKLRRRTMANNTFGGVALEWCEKFKPRWSEGHARRTLYMLEKHLFPWLGHRPIALIRAPELLNVLRRPETKGFLETARRAKNVAGQVFRYAVATGRAERDFTPDLKGALATAKIRHHPTFVDPKAVGSLMRAIDGYRGTPIVAAALKLSPLLFVRPGELRQMEWAEINWQESRWEIPAEKMKMRTAHIVPLCTQALEILEELEPITRRSKYVFPSQRGAKRPLSDNGVRTALRTLGYSNDEITPHGFRAMARTLLDEELGYRVDWIEHQLAHGVKDPNGRAYNRTKHLPQRREMMQGWADYLDKLKTAGNAVSADVARENKTTVGENRPVDNQRRHFSDAINMEENMS